MENIGKLLELTQQIMVLRHLPGEHNQKTHGSGGVGGIFEELPKNLTLLTKKTKNSIVGKLAALSANDLRSARDQNDKEWAEAHKSHDRDKIQAAWVKDGLIEFAIKKRKKDLEKQLKS